MTQFSEQEFQEPLTEERCRQWLVSRVFRFRPADYSQKYPKWPGMVGLEIEMLPFALGRKEVIPLNGASGSHGILREAAEPGWTPEFVDGDSSKGLLRIKLDENDQITFEPGGQIEFSSKPYPCLSDALDRMSLIQNKLENIFSPHGVYLAQSGIHPWQSPDSIGLQMKKARYQAMNEFFSNLGEFGPRMMRQTCTVQVNLDFGDSEGTLAKRFLVSHLIAPLATAMFANSPFCDGKDTGFSSYRARIWQGLDHSRTGFPKLEQVAAHMTLESCVTSYLDFLLDARVVFIEGANHKVMDGSLTLRDWIGNPVDGISPTLKDFETHLSLHFPEVRPRGFLELRSVDCMPRYFQELPAIFYASLLYDEKALDASLELMLPNLGKLTELLKKSAYGLKDDLLFDLTYKIGKLVLEGFERLPPCFQGKGSLDKLNTYMELFLSRRKTPADYLRPLLQGGGGLEVFRKLDDQWQSN